MLNRRTGKEKKIKQMHPLPPQSKDCSRDVCRRMKIVKVNSVTINEGKPQIIRFSFEKDGEEIVRFVDPDTLLKYMLFSNSIFTSFPQDDKKS